MKTDSFDSKTCRNLNLALQKEWKQKNAVGSYAAPTILGANTKRAHGWLVVRDGASKKHVVLLSGLEEILYIEERAYPLSTRLYGDSVFPKGFEFLESFYLAPYPVWIFRVAGLAFIKMALMTENENTVIVRYQLLSSYGDYVRLELRPVVALRNTAGPIGKEPHPDINLEAQRHRLVLKSPADPPLYFYHNAAVVDRTEQWFRGVRYPKTRRKGVEEQEDLFSPCSLHYAFLQEDGVFFCASTADKKNMNPASVFQQIGHNLTKNARVI